MATTVTQDEIAGTTLGYAQIISPVSTTNSAQTQATGLSVTCTIPNGGRKVKITVWAGAAYNATVNCYVDLTLWDGTVGSGTQLAAATWGPNSSASQQDPVTMMAIVTPAAGSKTYNVGFSQAAGGTANIAAATTNPAFILVELI